MELGTNDLSIEICKSVDEAPNYEKPEYRAANLQVARIVAGGTQLGNPTVDLIFSDENGQKYIAMMTGHLLEQLGQVIANVREGWDR
jgi:hypothetical protein